jgi:hypothetical protein
MRTLDKKIQFRARILRLREPFIGEKQKSTAGLAAAKPAKDYTEFTRGL